MTNILKYVKIVLIKQIQRGYELQINTETISGLGIIFFAFLGGLALLKQAWRIWKEPEKKGKSVNITWVSYFTCMYIVIFIYGVVNNYTPLIFNGSIRFLCHLPVLIGLYKFKGFSKFDKRFLAGVFVLALLTLLIPNTQISSKNDTTYMGLYFFIFSTVFLVVYIAQIIELIKNKSRGVLDGHLLTVYFIANLFWVVYSFAVKNTVLEVLNFVSLVLVVITTGLWIKYKEVKDEV